MKIAVMGAGALGGYFGGRLAEAGHEVSLIARGAHLTALREDGLRIVSPKGDLHLQGIRATDDPSDIGPVELILFMVKNRDVESAARAIRPMTRPETMILTCQNGVSAWERLGAIVGMQHVVPGVARIPAELMEPGVINHRAPLDMLTFGELDGRQSPRCTALHEALTGAGTTPGISANIIHELWAKFCGQSTLASLTTLTGLDLGPLRDNEHSARLFRDAMHEVERVGRAIVPDLPMGMADRTWAFLQGLSPHLHASMLDDLRRQKPLEHDYLSGEVVRLGRLHGVETPIHAVFDAALRPVAERLAHGG